MALVPVATSSGEALAAHVGNPGEHAELGRPADLVRDPAARALAGAGAGLARPTASCAGGGGRRAQGECDRLVAVLALVADRAMAPQPSAVTPRRGRSWSGRSVAWAQSRDGRSGAGLSPCRRLPFAPRSAAGSRRLLVEARRLGRPYQPAPDSRPPIRSADPCLISPGSDATSTGAMSSRAERTHAHLRSGRTPPREPRTNRILFRSFAAPARPESSGFGCLCRSGRMPNRNYDI